MEKIRGKDITAHGYEPKEVLAKRIHVINDMNNTAMYLSGIF